MQKALNHTGYFFDVKHESLPVIVKKRRGARRGARRIVLRYQPSCHALILTLPFYVTIEQGLGFIEKKRGWVLRQLDKRASPIVFAAGNVIPFLGRDMELFHVGGRGLIRQEGGKILVPGERAFMSRRLSDWLKSRAKEEITKRAHAKANAIGGRISKISLRDTHSRWGSCNRAGSLSFSWRLILAPEDVLDYVVAHEVAHLKELNHGPRFWHVVETLCPHWQASRRWLKRHGDALHRYR